MPKTFPTYPNGADDEDLAPYRAMSRKELELRAFAAEGRLRAVVETVRHWRGSEERTAAQGYIAPSVGADIYNLPPMAFAKHCGYVIPKNDGRNVGYHSPLTIVLGLYYDQNTHLSRPHDLAA